MGLSQAPARTGPSPLVGGGVPTTNGGTGLPAVAGRIVARPSVASADAWDAFSQRCGASFRCSYRASAAWQFEAHWIHRLVRLDLYLSTTGVAQKVGQCAVGIGASVAAFGDGLQVLPEHADLWAEGMITVLEHVGARAYVYGSEWSLEPPREATLAGLPGVTVTAVRRVSLQVIDFSRWETYADYLRAISTNVRRNARRAERDGSRLIVVEGTGLADFGRYVRAMRIRRAMFQRKGVPRSPIRLAVRSVARLVSTGRYSRTTYLLRDGCQVAYYVGIDYGMTSCYLEGAGEATGTGDSWFLLLGMIRRAYERSGGKGKFVMGSDNDPEPGDAAWEGLRRSRRQCCATPFPTSVVRFRYAGRRPTESRTSTVGDE